MSDKDTPVGTPGLNVGGANPLATPGYENNNPPTFDQYQSDIPTMMNLVYQP